MAKLPEKLTSSIKNIFGSKIEKKPKTPSKEGDVGTDVNATTISNNFSVLTEMSKGLKESSESVKQLVRIMGGKPSDELQPTPVETSKPTTTTPKTAPKIQKKKEKGVKSISDLKKMFSFSSIMKSLKTVFQIAGLISLLYLNFKDAFEEWVGTLWDTIKEKFDEFVKSVKDWFNEVIQPIIDGVKEFIDELVTKVGEFIKPIGEWIVKQFEKVVEFFEPVMVFLKGIFDKFLGIVDKIKTTLAEVIAPLLDNYITRKVLPERLINLIKGLLGIQVPPEPAKPKEEPAQKEKETTQRAAESREKSQQATEQAATSREKSQQATDKVAASKDKEKAEQEERDAAYKARQDALEAKNARQQARRAENEKKAQQGAPTPAAPSAAPAGRAESPRQEAQPIEASKTGAAEKPGTITQPTAPPKDQQVQVSPQQVPKGGKKGAAAGLSGRAADFANELPKYGITNKFAIQALVATSAKESGLDPKSKESGAEAYLKTLKGKGIEYIWKVFPQLKPGGWAAKRLGDGETGAQPATLEKVWSKGDEAFFDSVYGGLSTNPKAGDGYLYRGRGLIGITGRTVYRAVGNEVGMDLESDPDIVARDFKTAVAAAAGYMFMVRKGKEKALKDMNSFTDFDTALRYTLRSVAGLGHKEKDFEDKQTHLGHQLEKASQFRQLAEDAASGGTPVMSGAGVPVTTGSGGVLTTGTPEPTPTITTPKPKPTTPEAAPKKEMKNELEAEAVKSRDLVDAASKMVGLNENEHTQQLLDWLGKYSGTPYLPINTDAGPWCAKFVNAVLGTLGIKGTGLNTAFSFLKYGGVVFDKETGQGDVTAAQPGDIIITSRGGGKGHVAITESTTPPKVNVIGGNQSGKGHTGGVTRASTSLAAVIAIRRPGMKYTGESVIPTDTEANKQADLGKMTAADNLHASGTPKGPSGSEVSKASGDVASGQRQQQKSATPVVVNAPTNNNKVVQKVSDKGGYSNSDPSRELVLRTT